MASLEQRKDLFDRMMASRRSSFYRDLYGARSAPASETEWSLLPLLTKGDLLRVPYRARIFIEPEDVDIVRLTSGTSASGVLIIPRARRPFTEHEAPLMPVSSYMGFILPRQIYDNYAREGTKFIGGDPARLRESAVLAARMHVEGLAGLPATLLSFAEHLAAEYDVRHIRHLCFNGDSGTRLQRSVLKALYPEATMVSAYGSAETQGLCGIATAESKYETFLGHPGVHYEVIDAERRSEVSEGELVVTILEPNVAFPLIRYRTGDRAKLVEGGEKAVFELRGRAEEDRIRFDGGVILLASIEQAIERVCGKNIVDFEAVVSEKQSSGRPLLSLSIVLIPHADERFPANLTSTLAAALNVSERRTYAEAVARGSCAPLECRVAESGYGAGRKRRRLTDIRDH